VKTAKIVRLLVRNITPRKCTLFLNINFNLIYLYKLSRQILYKRNQSLQMKMILKT